MKSENYHQLFGAEPHQKILIVGGIGKGNNSNVLSINIDSECKPDYIDNINKTKFLSETFDFVFYEHLGIDLQYKDTDLKFANPDSFRESFRLLKPKGKLIISTGDLHHNEVKNYLLNLNIFEFINETPIKFKHKRAKSNKLEFMKK